MNLNVPGAIFPLGCTFLSTGSTGAKTVWGVVATPLRRTRVNTHTKLLRKTWLSIKNHFWKWKNKKLMTPLSAHQKNYAPFQLIKKVMAHPHIQPPPPVKISSFGLLQHFDTAILGCFWKTKTKTNTKTNFWFFIGLPSYLVHKGWKIMHTKFYPFWCIFREYYRQLNFCVLSLWDFSPFFKKSLQSNCFFFQTVIPKSLYNVEKSILMTFVKEKRYFSHQMSIKVPFVKIASVGWQQKIDLLQMCYIIYQYEVLYFEKTTRWNLVPGNNNIIGLNQRLALPYIVICHCMGCGAIVL